MGNKLVFSLKCIGSAVLLAILFSRVDAGALLAVLSSAQAGYLPIVLGLFVAAQLLSSVRWGLLARSLGFANSFVEFATLYWIGMFFNLFLPSIVGGDVGRAYYLVQSRRADSVSKLQWTGRAVTSVVADRAVGMMALVWMAALIMIVYPIAQLPHRIRYVIFALALAMPLLAYLVTFLGPVLRRWFRTIGDSVAEALDVYRGNAPLAISVLGLAVVIHLLTSTMYLPIGWSLGIDLPGPYIFATYAIVMVLSALPITFYGIGIRETALVFMLARIGVPPEKALAIGVVWFSVILILSLCGGVVFLVRKGHVARGVPRPE